VAASGAGIEIVVRATDPGFVGTAWNLRFIRPRLGVPIREDDWPRLGNWVGIANAMRFGPPPLPITIEFDPNRLGVSPIVVVLLRVGVEGVPAD
jgi:hypothetical protein